MSLKQNSMKISKRERNFWALVILSLILAIVAWRHGSNRADSLGVDPNNPGQVISANPTPEYDCSAHNPFSEANLANWNATHSPGAYNATVIDLVHNCTYSAGNPDAKFPTASTGKILVATGVLEKVAQGQIEYASVQADMTSMITQSDNSAADRLFAAIGKAATLQDIEVRYGMSATVTDRGWGTTMTNSSDQAKLLSQVIGTQQSPLPEAQRVILRDLMKNVNPEQSWGAGTNIPAGWSIAVKNGWYQAVAGDIPPEGKWRINTLGMTWDQTGTQRWIFTAYSNEWASQSAGISAWNDFAALVAQNLAN